MSERLELLKQSVSRSAERTDGAIRKSLMRETREGYGYEKLDFLEYAQEVGSEILGYDYVIDEDNKATILNAIKWLYNQPFIAVDETMTGAVEGDPSKGLLITGDTGTGKTTLIRMLYALSQFEEFQVFSMGKAHPLLWRERRAEEWVFNYLAGDISSIKEIMYEVPVTCIQDLGTEPKEAVYMGTRMKVLKQIIEARGDLPMLTIITTNLSLKKLEERYEDRVYSRILGNYNILPLVGKDRRLQ